MIKIDRTTRLDLQANIASDLLYFRTQPTLPAENPVYWQVDMLVFEGSESEAMATAEPESNVAFTDATTSLLIDWNNEEYQTTIKHSSDAKASEIVLAVYDFQGQIALKDYYPLCTEIGQKAIDCAKAWVAKVYSVHTGITIKMDLGLFVDNEEMQALYSALPPAPAKFQTIMNLGLGVPAKASAMPTLEQQTLEYWNDLLATLTP